MRLLRIALLFVVACAPPAGYAQSTAAGTVTLLNGQAQVSGPGTPLHALAKGDAVYGGDIVETGAASYTLIRFTDQGSVLLRPNSRFQVEKYQYSGAAPPATAPEPAPAQRQPLAAQASSGGGADSSFFRLLKGGLRAVSGLIGHADYSHYRMSTPVATMGIRGTDYEIALCEDTCLNDPAVLNSIPAGKTAAGGVVSGVNDGQIVVTSFTGHSVTIGPGQYCITLADGSQYLLNAIPAFLNPGSAGVAAGGVTAAASAAQGGILTGVLAGGAAAAVLGVVIGTSGNNGSSTSTSTSTSTHP